MLPRKIDLHPKTKEKLNQLRLESSADSHFRVSSRVHAIILNSEGKTSGEISNLIKVSRSQVSLWLKNYEQCGVQGLLEGHRSGRPKGLDFLSKQILADIIDSGPISYGYLSGVWTASMISKVIQSEFRISYHPGHVRKILKQIGFSVQRPKRLLANADPIKQDRWTRYTYPNLKKRQLPAGQH
jgi:transposase